MSGSSSAESQGRRSTLREMCGQNKLVNHLRSSSHNEGPKKQKTFFSENIHRQRILGGPVVGASVLPFH